jgi:cysteine synthase A
MTHEERTGEEIWSQLQGKVDYFATIIGTGGTFVGVSKTLKRHKPDVKCYAAEPANASVLAGKAVRSTKHKLQGTGYAFVPPLWDSSVCDDYLTATDKEAINAARLISNKEGIVVGFSSGANVAAVVKLAKKARERENIVTLLPDTGLKYLSTELFQLTFLATHLDVQHLR